MVQQYVLYTTVLLLVLVQKDLSLCQYLQYLLLSVLSVLETELEQAVQNA